MLIGIETWITCTASCFKLFNCCSHLVIDNINVTTNVTVQNHACEHGQFFTVASYG